VSQVTGLVLAAGEGRRFGRPKALVELGGETLLDRAVRVLRDGGCDGTVVVVTAPGLAGASDRAPGAGVVVVTNPDWRSGMGSSLRVGLGSVNGDAAVLMLVDTPGIGAEVVRRLLAAHRGGATVAVATYAGRPRNPVLLARAHWAEAVALAVGDVGARPFLAAHPELVTGVECGDIADPADVDTPEDLAAFQT
jgi:CTP:molybdopterin cytidylyltransferase MocA